MPHPLRVAVIGPSNHRRVARLLSAFGTPERPDVVHVFGDARRRDSVRAPLVLTPTGPPAPVPAWVARVLLPSQYAARAWARVVPLGRLVVVEPPAVPDPTLGPLYEADEADAFDPERLLAAVAAGVPVRSSIVHDLLPPPVGAAAWALRGRAPDHEIAALTAIYAEVVSMARRGR